MCHINMILIKYANIFLLNNLEYLIMKNRKEGRFFDGPQHPPHRGGRGKIEKEHRGTEKLCEYKTLEQSLPVRGRGEEQVQEKYGGNLMASGWETTVRRGSELRRGTYVCDRWNG